MRGYFQGSAAVVTCILLFVACDEKKPDKPKKATVEFSIPGAVEKVQKTHPDGTHKVSVYTKEGTADKIAEVHFHPNGQPYINKHFENDTLNGESWSYYPDGKPWSVNTFKQGKYEGLYRTWHENGKLNIDGFYKDGKEDGEWFIYYPSGTLNTRGLYRNGEKTGVWSSYNMEGTLMKEQDFTK